MMRYILSVCFILSFAFWAHSQSSVYRAGDTLYIARDLLPDQRRLVLESADGRWDFGGLAAPFVREIYVRPAVEESGSEGGDRLIFAGLDDINYYLKIEKNNVFAYAFDVRVDGLAVRIDCEPPVPLRINDLPTGETRSYSGSVEIPLPTSVVAALDDPKLAFADSLKVVVNWEHYVENKGDGVVDIESGLFESERHDVTRYVEESIETKKNGKWTVSSNPVPVELTLPLELRGGRSVAYWSDRSPGPVALIELDADGKPETVQFNANPRSGRRVVKRSPSGPDIFVHPNPSFGNVRFDLMNLPRGAYRIEIYNIIGVLLETFEFDIDGTMTIPVDLTDLKKGTYIYRLVDEYEKTIRSKRLVIITP